MLILGESTTVNTLKKGWDLFGPEIEGQKFDFSKIFGAEIPETWKNRLMPAKVPGQN